MALYHYTDPRNLFSIKKYGLLSWNQLLQKKIEHFPASDELSRNLDKNKGLEDFIRLYLPANKPQPMIWRALYSGRVSGITYIEVDDIVMTWADTLFSSDNATTTSRDIIIDKNRETAFNSKTEQAEVLVKSHIPIEYLKFPK